MTEHQNKANNEIKTEMSTKEEIVKDKVSQAAKWLDNEDNEVEQVFGFNKNAELVNSRAAMIGFLMLVLTELIFQGNPVTMSIFGIN